MDIVISVLALFVLALFLLGVFYSSYLWQEPPSPEAEEGDRVRRGINRARSQQDNARPQP